MQNDIIYLREDIANFDEFIPYEKILIVADLGLWYGRKQFTTTVASLYEAISKASEDYNTFYFKNKNATLSLKAIHHDGTNNFKFYKIIKGKKYAIKYNDIYRG